MISKDFRRVAPVLAGVVLAVGMTAAWRRGSSAPEPQNQQAIAEGQKDLPTLPIKAYRTGTSKLPNGGIVGDGYMYTFQDPANPNYTCITKADSQSGIACVPNQRKPQ